MLYTKKIGNRTVAVEYSLDQQIHSIANALYYNSSKVRLSGVLNGRAGATLLFGYLSKAYPGQQYDQMLYEHLEELTRVLSQKELSHSLSTGKAGIAFVFQHLRNIGIIDPAEGLDLAQQDKLISIGADRDFGTRNWDPLQGLAGLGVYYLERHKETGEPKYLEKIVDRIASLATEANGNIVWTSNGAELGNGHLYNFGMAHGMPGLLSFLAQVYELSIRQETIAGLISSCMDFLLSYRASRDRLYSFPAAVGLASEGGKPRIHPSWRHGWCYGDLGIAFALIHCGRALGRPEWRQKGIAIALRTTAVSFDYSGCEDAPLCHGTVGLVHQYHRLYQATENPRFKESIDRWLQLTMDHYYQPGRFPGGYACRTYDDDENRLVSIPSYGLLEGIAGIGLVYLCHLQGVKPDWDVLFKTNI